MSLLSCMCLVEKRNAFVFGMFFDQFVRVSSTYTHRNKQLSRSYNDN